MAYAISPEDSDTDDDTNSEEEEPAKKTAKRYINEREDSDEEGDIPLIELAKRLKVKKEAQMENETDPERKADLSEDELGGGEEPMDSVESEIDSDSQVDPVVDDSENAMSVNKVTSPSILQANRIRKLRKKQTINTKSFKQLFQAISDMF